ncbi:hypothetical protein RFI_21963 [Reticulomyxa filosa]|uniref:TRAF-type domain-containing protein n=1 Tax=Reticulomyxa filosa TaxID=46433 RepID=X6MPS1_RETFI|nr:hypothetical protein RFI_21963 [Reticulomyxa filosa]|eukprot:ETO15402.1 hypothetical protein RFI_21963 [Reticulomyxa filosa]
MSKVNEEKLKDEQEAVLLSNSFKRQLCFDKSWVLQLNESEQINRFTCLICKQVANNPVEINCPQHEDVDESLIAGENCLKQFLSDNNNKCPVRSHNGCKYTKNKLAQRRIGDLTVKCPIQFQQNLKISGINEEGQSAEGTRVMCDFKGQIKDLSEHLDKACSLELLECWFKHFGCKSVCPKYELEYHFVSTINEHIDLVMNEFALMRQTIQQLRVKSIFVFKIFQKKLWNEYI